MIVLGIESSCDETGAALISDTKGLLADALHTQIDMHRAYGAPVSFMAASPVRQPPIARRNPFKLDDSGACPPIGCLNRQAFILNAQKLGIFLRKNNLSHHIVASNKGFYLPL